MVMKDCGIIETADKIESATQILLKYNTRENYREYEVSSDTIFEEIFNAWRQDTQKITVAKKSFYCFFHAEAVCFDDTIETLSALSSNSKKLGYLTDAAYGMDNEYSLSDIEPIRKYFDAGFTSIDVGFRKPHGAGYQLLLRELKVTPAQMMYVGDEEKDIVGANRVGIVSVLINRSGEEKKWGQQYTIQRLSDLPGIV